MNTMPKRERAPFITRWTCNATSLTATLLACFILSGCSFLSSKPSRFFSLDRLPPSAAVGNIGGAPIGIDVVLPPGLDRKEVVVRQADHQLEIRGREQWTASLEPLVLHTLAFDLASRLPDGMLILPGEKQTARMRLLDVVVEELAAGPQREVILDARWTLRDDLVTATKLDPRIGSVAIGGVAHHEHIAIDLPSLDSAAIAAGTSQALATLADRIVSQLTAR